ncbi:invasion protein IagB [Serratia quinivorans]|uniref:lytic transglycosylase domain-containing protein n=1 Tax=Serratia quinivorans TaxID=137545 RepID=UPI00217B4BB2|nr:lytic transglycosylase domain-containing protein [Serratia quinivorans]CAI1905721.1 invasion protein IagB [Serratia quinivorans]
MAKKFKISILLLTLFSWHTHASCINQAANRWNIPPVILEAIISKESNWRKNAIGENSNGSKDFGLMQINSINIPKLKSEKIILNKAMLLNPCHNINAGAYLLQQKFKKHGYSWKAVGAYHSETPKRRDKYAKAIRKIVAKNQDMTPLKNKIFSEHSLEESTISYRQ